jgi:hypothetical protein
MEAGEAWEEGGAVYCHPLASPAPIVCPAMPHTQPHPAAPTVELIGQPAAVRKCHTLAPLARQQQVQQCLCHKPGHIHAQRLPGEKAMGRWEAWDAELGG